MPGEKASGKSIAALILGIASLVLCFIPLLNIILGFIGMIMGIGQRRALSRGEITAKSSGMATGGMITGIIGIVVGIVMSIVISTAVILPIIFVPEAQKAANKASCVANLRTLDASVDMYYAEYEKYPSGIQDLLDSNTITKEPKCPSGTAPYIYNSTTHKFSCPNINKYPDHKYK